jgi:hypothetical protein
LEWKGARKLLLFRHSVTAGFEFAALGNSSRNRHRQGNVPALSAANLGIGR